MEPVYEIPSDKYAVEDIIRILLNPKIGKEKICKQHPLDITTSSTYVVDLDSLEHPDDVKRDDFGVWTHSGSHNQAFMSRINECGDVEIGRTGVSKGPKWEKFSLRQLHSKHPTNALFRRVISFIIGMLITTVLPKHCMHEWSGDLLAHLLAVYLQSPVLVLTFFFWMTRETPITFVC